MVLISSCSKDKGVPEPSVINDSPEELSFFYDDELQSMVNITVDGEPSFPSTLSSLPYVAVDFEKRVDENGAPIIDIYGFNINVNQE